MKLLTKEIEKKLKPMGYYEETEPKDIPIAVKYFNPTGAGTWYAYEYDPERKVFWGFAEITEGEIGTFSLDELESFVGRMGLGIERDLYTDLSKYNIQDLFNGKRP